MSYFCIVKLLRHIFTSTVICFISLISSEVQAFNYTNGRDAGLDSVKISLLTCSAGDEVYSLYGHTAIRYTDEKYGVDEVINYGVFSFSKPFFVLRFIFGLTDYEMGIMPFEMFCAEYRSEGRSVIQQDLNLTRGEKAAIRDALIANYRPENRVYRYNYFYDNCTTRARDIICDNINGKVRYPGQQQPYPSFRSLIHKFNDEHPWARFGNDMLLGVKADKKTDQSEHQFLPFFLMKDFDKAEIIGADGKPRPLVTKRVSVEPESMRMADTCGNSRRVDSRVSDEEKILGVRHLIINNRRVLGRHHLHDVLLRTSYDKHQPPSAAAQSAAADIRLPHGKTRREKTARPILDLCRRGDNNILHWRIFPGIRRRNAHFGTIFADKVHMQYCLPK